MKYLILLSFSLLIFSCGSNRKVVNTKPQTESITKDSTQVTIKEASIETLPEETIEEPVENIEKFNHTSWDNLLEQHVSNNGNVDYNSFLKNKTTLRNYIIALGENTPKDAWSKNDKLAYWINAYNALTVDLILKNLPLKSIKDIKNPWDQRLWKIGEKWMTLNDIEHRILRKMNEPRIHFAIVCASYSCPKLLNKAFTATNLEHELTVATKDFLSDTNRNNITENTIKISKIFKWFSKDFKTNGSIIDFINQYSAISVSKKAKTSFKDYNWNLNN